MEVPNFDPTDTFFNREIVTYEIEHEDIFHLKNIYKYIHRWFTDNGYFSVDSNDEKFETLYFHRVLGNDNLEHHIWWRLHKTPDKSPYLKYFIKFDFQTLNMGKTKVKDRGQDIGTNVGDLIIRCSGYLMLDYDKSWRKHKYLKLIHKWFIIRIYKKQIDYYEEKLYTEMYELQSLIKQYMNLKNPQDRPKSFHPDLGL
jgi:hypothetical protein